MKGDARVARAVLAALFVGIAWVGVSPVGAEAELPAPCGYVRSSTGGPTTTVTLTSYCERPCRDNGAGTGIPPGEIWWVSWDGYVCVKHMP